MHTSKICKTCKQLKSLASFSKNKNCADGHLTECKSCNKIYRQTHAKHKAEVEKKRRRKLGIKPKKVFLTKEEKRQAQLQSSIKWQQTNKKYVKTYQKQYYQNNKDIILERTKRWRKQHRYRVNAYTALRRKIIKRATPAWANFEKIIEVYKMAQELTEKTGIVHVVDHYYPLNGYNVCGLHVFENLQVITQQENLLKGRKHPEEFYNGYCSSFNNSL